jgi:hypothetical protein
MQSIFREEIADVLQISLLSDVGVVVGFAFCVPSLVCLFSRNKALPTYVHPDLALLIYCLDRVVL